MKLIERHLPISNSCDVGSPNLGATTAYGLVDVYRFLFLAGVTRHNDWPFSLFYFMHEGINVGTIEQTEEKSAGYTYLMSEDTSRKLAGTGQARIAIA